MVNFMCHLDWVTGYTDIWLDIIQGVSVRMFLDEMNISISRWSKADCPPQCWQALSNLLKVWIEHFLRKGEFTFWAETLVFSPKFRLKLRPPAPWLFSLQILGLLALYTLMGQVLIIYLPIYLYFLLVLFLWRPWLRQRSSSLPFLWGLPYS